MGEDVETPEVVEDNTVVEEPVTPAVETAEEVAETEASVEE